MYEICINSFKELRSSYNIIFTICFYLLDSPSDILYCRRVSKSNVKSTSRKMRMEKSIGPNNIPIDVYKCVEKKRIKC